MKKILKDGPIKYSEPLKEKEAPKMIDYQKYQPTVYANTIKLDIDNGEDRFPSNAKVPNKKKYDKKGNYVRHKFPKKNVIENREFIESMGMAARNMALSNKLKRNG